MICRIQEIDSTQNYHLSIVAAEVAKLGTTMVSYIKVGFQCLVVMVVAVAAALSISGLCCSMFLGLFQEDDYLDYFSSVPTIFRDLTK